MKIRINVQLFENEPEQTVYNKNIGNERGKCTYEIAKTKELARTLVTTWDYFSAKVIIEDEVVNYNQKNQIK